MLSFPMMWIHTSKAWQNIGSLLCQLLSQVSLHRLLYQLSFCLPLLQSIQIVAGTANYVTERERQREICPYCSLVWANLDMAVDERVWRAVEVVRDKMNLSAPMCVCVCVSFCGLWQGKYRSVSYLWEIQGYLLRSFDIALKVRNTTCCKFVELNWATSLKILDALWKHFIKFVRIDLSV